MKLARAGQSVADFCIQERGQQGLAGLVSLVGIESPVLTASLAIARMVREMMD